MFQPSASLLSLGKAKSSSSPYSSNTGPKGVLSDSRQANAEERDARQAAVRRTRAEQEARAITALGPDEGTLRIREGPIGMYPTSAASWTMSPYHGRGFRSGSPASSSKLYTPQPQQFWALLRAMMGRENRGGDLALRCPAVKLTPYTQADTSRPPLLRALPATTGRRRSLRPRPLQAGPVAAGSLRPRSL